MLFLRLQRELRNLICEAKGIIFIAEGERLNLFVDYKVESSLIDSIVIRNGVSSQAYEQSQSLDNKFRDIDVLVCGRIEERKNQVNLAKIFAGEPVNISFLGALNENNVAYCEEFINLIENNDNLTYLGAVDSLSTSLYFRKAKIHLSASFFEVSSLVDIEAYYAGCAVISSKNGFSGEILKGDGVVFIDPYSRDDILARTFEMLESYNTNGYPNRATESHLTWQKAAAELVAYVA
jgi:glycosyltransferase involved in cell wall biosynthesis